MRKRKMSNANPSQNVPVGIITPWAGTLGTNGANLPNGWLDCNGGALSTTTYSALFAVIGYAWGGSGNTFYLPDLRGYFLRGVDEGAGNDPDTATRAASSSNGGNSGDAVGSSQADQVGPFTASGPTVTVNVPPITVNVPTQYTTAGNVQSNPFLTGYSMNIIPGGYLSGYENPPVQAGSVPASSSAVTASSTGGVSASLSTTETRAKNKYVYWIIFTGQN
jgi:microcystin-dependent protein